MIKKLKEIFPSLVEANEEVSIDTDNFFWFTTPENKLVGFPCKELSKKESLLLETFLTPYHANQPPVTKREEQWIHVLFNNGNAKQFHDQPQIYRFVYFSLSDDTIDGVAFREAIHGLFSTKVPIIWENSHQGVIIEENMKSDESDISYHEIIEVLMSDFYMNVNLFISPYFNVIDACLQQYKWTKSCFCVVHKYCKSPVVDYIESVPYLLLEPLDEESIPLIVTSILQDATNDEELLKTVQIFLECNSNATLAAKKLYMHRNSLQYRVDKFIEKSSIDVKQFKGALSVYLTLMLKQKI
ncbi:PucR family transcriptional regulator [Aquibacillus saliphilus]|uniref:PucR family transcriptional regulator n=1 Tax=Aquibacillus saliphilus TaxID=1909422 RepID=UPI001CF02DC3|nr:helix-turn-helix domain-containing protein [Aquibacillus saliphilus]